MKFQISGNLFKVVCILMFIIMPHFHGKSLTVTASSTLQQYNNKHNIKITQTLAKVLILL